VTPMTQTEAQTGLWQNGWYRFARPLKSPNFGSRPEGTRVDLLVIHSISLPPGVYGGDQVQRLFTNQLDPGEHAWFERLRGLQVSAHFYIQRQGQLWQFVSCDHRAWHAGQSCFRGRDNCNDFSVGIELEGIEGDLFEPAQYETLTSVCTAVAQHYPVTQAAGHEHVAPGRKQDPGHGFDWPLLQSALGWSPQCFPLGVTGDPTD
jgi:AmpD protein